MVITITFLTVALKGSLRVHTISIRVTIVLSKFAFIYIITGSFPIALVPYLTCTFMTTNSVGTDGIPMTFMFIVKTFVHVLTIETIPLVT